MCAWFVGDDGVGGCRGSWDRACQLAGHKGQGVACLAFCQGFADADDGDEACVLRALGFCGDGCVGFAVVGAAF